MKRPSRLEHVKFVAVNGEYYAYFNTGRKKDGRPIRIPLGKWGAVGFFDRYTAALAGRNRKALHAYTVERLCDEYRDSREYAALSQGTQKAYGVYLRLVVQLLGKATVDDLTRADIQMILDNEEWGAGKSNLFVAVIGAAYKWARARDKATVTPTREMPTIKTGEHQPWPDDLLDAGLTAKNDRIRLAVALLFYTGQRIGDVCKMRWADLKTGKLKVVQQKTGKPLTIKLYSALQVELDAHGKRGLTLLTNDVGGPLHPDKLRAELKAFVAAQGHAEHRPHGLRKNAVIALLTAECSVAETAAITGQTYQLVEYYARRIDQERMADGAILKMERFGNRQSPGKYPTENGGLA